MYKPVGCLCFSYDKKYVLVEIRDEKYDVVMPVNDVPSKSYPIVALIMSFISRFNMHVTCWEHVVKYGGVDYFTVLLDFDSMLLGDDHDLLHIDDMNSVDCSDRLKWLVYMSLDNDVKNMEIGCKVDLYN